MAEIVNYIESRFGELIAEKYYSDVLENIDNLNLNPELFPIYQHKTATRKAIINKKNILYYQIKKENINLLAFYDVQKAYIKFKIKFCNMLVQKIVRFTEVNYFTL